MFGGVNVWRTAELKLVRKKTWQVYILAMRIPIMSKNLAGKPWTICQTFLLPNLPAIQYNNNIMLVFKGQ